MAQRISPRLEYEAALAAYTKAQQRLIEAKLHYDPKTAPEAIEKRNAKAAEYRAKRRAARNIPEEKAARKEYRERRRREIEEYQQRWNAT